MRDKNSPSPSKNAKKDDGFSIADIISILGLLSLCLFLFLGWSYGGTSSGIALLSAIGCTIGIGLILFLLLKAKRAETDFGKWRIVEFVLLGVFVLSCAATVPVLSKFFNINSASAELKSAGREDLENLKNALDKYKETEESNLRSFCAQLNNVQYCNSELRKFCSKNSITVAEDGKPYTTNIKSFFDRWQQKIQDLSQTDGANLYATYMKRIENNSTEIEKWNIIELPYVIPGVGELSEDIKRTITEFSKSLPFNVSGAELGLNNYSYKKFSPDTPKDFQEKIANINGLAVSGVVTSIFLFFLILFSYLVAFRSSKVGVKAGSLTHDGGQILKN